jgi:tRNA(Ile)-lysidine synthase TilS/MesJ
VRPFVELPKKSLLTALSLNNQTDFAMDNLDLARKGSRAWVRHEIIPGLQGHETNISKRLDYLAQAERHKKAILTKLAENLVEYFESHAVINLENRPEPLLIELATRAVLRNWYKDKDLRQAKSTIAKLAGLDRSPQRFIVNDLKPKEFVLPGAVAYSNGKEIIIKRVGKTE